VDRDIAKLVGLRNDDGGWPWWQRGRPSDPWVSATAVHALVLADEQGYNVPRAHLDAGLGFLSVIEQYIPSEWGPEATAAVRSYAVYVRGEAGQRDPAKAATVYQESGDHLRLDAMAWLWPSLDDAGMRAE